MPHQITRSIEMCGFVGVFARSRDFVVNRSALQDMTAVLSHRGPDGQGVFVGPGVGLGHRRLAVIDLEGGQQPMIDEGSGRVIAFNGEVYNYGRLRSRLLGAGHRFRTRSDTEVLLKMSLERSLSWIEGLSGMFAFAVWDPSTDELLLVRDRLGVKPLYYTVVNEVLIFGSEIKSLLRYPGVAARLDKDIVAEFLAFRGVLEPKTMFDGIFQLPAGHLLKVDRQRFSIQPRRYWEERPAAVWDPTLASEKKANGLSVDEQFNELFADTIHARLISDVPVGTFNSGGVDSSLVTREVRRHTSGELHTFSVGFEEASHDESGYALQVAKKTGTIHHTLSLSGIEYADLLPQAIWHHDEPLSHPHSIHLMQLSHLAKQYVTVVLTGEGADEAFAGYPRHHIARMALSRVCLPRILGKALKRTKIFHGNSRSAKLIDGVAGGRLGVALGTTLLVEQDWDGLIDIRAATDRRMSVLDELLQLPQSKLESILEFDRRTYLPALLARLDKMTMSAGLEARGPFLDYRLIEWSKTVGAWQKVGIGFSNKKILKRKAAAVFSRDMVYRRKVGFGVPLAKWFREEASMGRYLSLLMDESFRQRGHVDAGRITKMVNDHRAGRRDYSEMLWRLVNLEVWIRNLSSATQSG